MHTAVRGMESSETAAIGAVGRVNAYSAVGVLQPDGSVADLNMDCAFRGDSAFVAPSCAIDVHLTIGFQDGNDVSVGLSLHDPGATQAAQIGTADAIDRDAS